MEQQPKLESTFLWPDTRFLAGHSAPAPDFLSILKASEMVLGVVHGLTDQGVRRLAEGLRTDAVPAGNGHPPIPKPKHVRLIVTLYPACPTSGDVLKLLLSLQQATPNLTVKVTTCGF